MSSKHKKTRQYATMKRVINVNDQRLKQRELEIEQNDNNQSRALAAPRGALIQREKRKRGGENSTLSVGKKSKKLKKTGVDDGSSDQVNRVKPILSSMYFSHNTQLGPPYHILVDTNFINFSIQNKLDLFQATMDCLYAKCTPYLTDCVMGELEKLGHRFRVAMRIARDPRFKRLKCTHKGTYADDCIVERVQMHKCYIVATCDKDLRRRIRKIPGVPCMYITQRKYTIERMPDAFGAPRNG